MRPISGKHLCSRFRKGAGACIRKPDKTKLGSQTVFEGGPSMKNFVGDFLSRELDNFLHRNPSTAEALKKNRTERKGAQRTGGDQETGQRKGEKTNLHNRKLRDCKFHYNDEPSGKDKDKIIESKRKAPYS